MKIQCVLNPLWMAVCFCSGGGLWIVPIPWSMFNSVVLKTNTETSLYDPTQFTPTKAMCIP